MKFFIPLHHYMVIVMLWAVLGSFNNNFATSQTSLTVEQKNVCSLLPKLNPQGSEGSYNEFISKLRALNVSVCDCIKANRKRESKLGIRKVHQKLAELTQGSVVLTDKDYKARVIKPSKLLTESDTLPAHSKEEIIFEGPFPTEAKQAIIDTYHENNLKFPLKVILNFYKGTSIKNKEGTEILQLDLYETSTKYNIIRGTAQHELAGHSLNGDYYADIFYNRLISEKLTDNHIILTDGQNADFNNTYAEHITKNKERNADQISCACSSLAIANYMLQSKEYELNIFNIPETPTHPSCKQRHDDAKRIVRLREIEASLEKALQAGLSDKL